MLRFAGPLPLLVPIIGLFLLNSVECRAQTATAETLSPPILAANTPVMLRVKKNLYKKDAKPGQPLEFEVVEDVVVAGLVVIPSGAAIHGSVRQVDQTGKGPGKALIDMGSAQTISGEALRLTGPDNATDDADHDKPTLKDVGGMVSYSPEIIPALPVVVPVLAVMQLFPGKKVLLHKDVQAVAHVAENVGLDATKLKAAQAQLEEPAKPKDDIPEGFVFGAGSSGELDAEIAAIKTMIGMMPNRIQLHYELGRLLVKKNDPDAAIVELQWALGNGKYPLANCLLGRALELKGDLEAAFVQYHTSFQVGVPDEECHAAYERLQIRLKK